MKKVLKIFWNNLKIILGVCVVVCAFYFGYNYLNSKFRNPDAYYNDSFHNMPEDSIDVIVLGSSHAQYSFVPSFFYEDTGLYSYVLGSAFQPVKVSYLMLKEVLKTQSPEMVILEVFTATLGDIPINENRYVMAEYQMTGDERKEAISYLPKEKQIEYYNEFINNHNNWRTISSLDELKINKSYKDASLGYIQNSITLPVDNYWYSFTYDEDVDVQLMEEDVDALNNIYNLCQENDIDLLLYMVPMDEVTQENQSYRHKVWQWAEERNIKYIDLLENDKKIDIRSAIDHDGFHMYTNGANIVTDELASFTLDNYNFDNHKDNEELNTLYQKGAVSYAIDAVRTEFNVYKYMQRVITYPELVMIKYSGDYQSQRMLDYLSKIGVQLIEGRPFYGVVYNGELLASSTTDLEYDFDGTVIKISDNKIEFNENIVECNELLTFIVSKSGFSDYTKKIVNYIDGYPWQYGYDFDYNPVN